MTADKNPTHMNDTQNYFMRMIDLISIFAKKVQDFFVDLFYCKKANYGIYHIQGCAYSGRQWSGLATTQLKIATHQTLQIHHYPIHFNQNILDLTLPVVAITILNLGIY